MVFFWNFFMACFRFFSKDVCVIYNLSLNYNDKSLDFIGNNSDLLLYERSPESETKLGKSGKLYDILAIIDYLKLFCERQRQKIRNFFCQDLTLVRLPVESAPSALHSIIFSPAATASDFYNYYFFDSRKHRRLEGISC